MATTLLYKTAADQPNFATETAVAGYEPARPYPQNPQVIVYRTRFMQLRAFYTRPAALTPHPDLPQVYFADDVDFQDKTSGLVEWTRVYTTLPSSWNDFGSEAYSYPGYQGTLSVLGRNPFSHIVTTKITRDYFAVGTFQSYASYIQAAANSSGVGSSNGSTFTSNAANVPACAGGSNIGGVLLANVGASGDYYVYASNGSVPLGMSAASVFIRSNSTTKARVDLFEGTFSQIATINVDLSTGQPIGTPNANSYQIAPVGDGWWRVAIVGNAVSSSLRGMSVYALNANGNSNYTGAGQSIDVWRMQVTNSNTAPYPTVPPTVTGDGTTNYPITSADQIPVKFGTRYLYQVPWGVGGSNAVASQFVAEFLSDGGYGLVATSPTLSNYKNYVTTDSGNTNSYSIESQDSVQTLWYGAIWERQRRYVKAI